VKILAPILIAAAASFSLAACEDTYGPYGYGYGGYYDYDYGPYAYGWYDGYYGPFYDGYWGPTGVFIFRDRDGRMHRDDGGHFRHQAMAGFRQFRGHMRQPSGAAMTTTRGGWRHG